MVKKFLVGTRPVGNDMYRLISMYKEMEAAGTLERGPIELQYSNHLRKKSSRGERLRRTANVAKDMVQDSVGVQGNASDI